MLQDDRVAILVEDETGDIEHLSVYTAFVLDKFVVPSNLGSGMKSGVGKNLIFENDKNSGDTT